MAGSRTPGPGQAIELGVTYLSLIGETRRLVRDAKDAVDEAQRYATTHPLALRGHVDIDIPRIRPVEVPVVADTRRFGLDIRGAIESAQVYARAHPIDLRADVDTSRIRVRNLTADIDVDAADLGRKIDAAVAAASAGTRSVPVQVSTDVDTARIRSQIDTALTSSTAPFHADVTLSANAERLRRDVQAINDLAVAVRLDLSSPEVARFLRELKDQLRNRRDVTVPVSPEISGFAAFSAELRRRLQDARFSARVDVSADTARIPAEIQRAMREIGRNFDFAMQVRIDPDFSSFPLDVARYLRQIQGLFRFTVPVDLDTARAMAQAEALRRQLEQLGRNVDVDIDIDRSAGSRATSLAANIGSISKAAAGTAAVAAALAAIGGAAGSALGAVGALAAGLVALGPAAAAAVSTVAVGVQGIGDAFKALSAAENSAGSDAAAQAKAIAAAQDQLASALSSAESAQRNLTDAEKDARDATKDIAQAYKEAADELEDYQLKLRDANLSEREAALAVREARDELAKAKPEDREKAFLRLERAELRYMEAQERNRDVQEAANDAEAKGIEGSDKVLAAKDRAAKANERVAEAQRQVEQANRQVAKAQEALADAHNQSSGAQDKAAQALAKLSPEAREFVLAVREMKPVWQEFQNAVQDSLFSGAAQGIRDLVANALPTLKAGMVGVADAMNGLTHQFAAFFQTPQSLEGIRATFAGTKGFIDGLGPGLQQATQGFFALGVAAEPVANKVGAQFANMLGQIGAAFSSAAGQGSLTAAVSGFGDILQGIGLALNPITQGLIQMGAVVGPQLGAFIVQLGQSIGAVLPSLGQLGSTFLTALQPALPVLADLVKALSDGLRPVLPIVGELLRNILTAVQPLVGPMTKIAQVVGTALSQAVVALQPAIGPLGEAFASLVTALAPLVPVVAEVVSGIVQALAPALKIVFDALAPVIQQWADLMMPVFRQLQPILAQVAQQLGTALADALQQLAPHLPALAQSFGDLVLAIAPLLPQIVEIVTKLLPPLLDIIIQILPQLTKLIDAFTWLVNNVIGPIVLPALGNLASEWAKVFQACADSIRIARDFFAATLREIGTFFTTLGTVVETVWNGVVRKIAVAVKAIGELLQRIPTVHIPGTNITIGEGIAAIGTPLVAWAAAHGAARGGRITGPGTSTSDDIPLMVSDGEFIINSRATSANLPLLEAINAGWVPSAAFLRAMVGDIPGFAEGGVVPGKKFAQSMDPVPYMMGGFSRQSIDCSGMVSATINDALGRSPFSSRMSTVNEGQWLASLGAKPGLGGPGDISVGWFDRGGGANGHTALTLGDGTNVESRGGDGVVVGPGAAGAADKMFDRRMHIPAALLRGGDLGGPATNTPGRSSGTGGGTGGAGGGAGGGTGGAGLGGATGANGGAPAGVPAGVTSVFVTNWPTGLTTGTTTTTTSTSTTTTTPTLDANTGLPTQSPGDLVPRSAPATSTPVQTSPLTAGTGQHPLAQATQGLPGPLGQIFQGPAPWYLASSPEQALTNLGTQAAQLAQKTGTGFVDLFKGHWKEMLNTGLAVAGMGIGGGGGAPMVVNNYGMDPRSAAQAVERQQRRRTLANQRGGGFGR